jgi:hypothetical protein
LRYGIVDKLEFNRFGLKGLWHRNLPTFEHPFMLPQEDTDSSLRCSRNVGTHIDLANVVIDGRCCLSFVCLPPSSERTLPNMTYQWLPLLLAMRVSADPESIEARHAEQNIARTRQLRRKSDESGKRVHLALVQDLEGALPAECSAASTTHDSIDDDVMNLVKELNDGHVYVGHGVEAALNASRVGMSVLPDVNLGPQGFSPNKRRIRSGGSAKHHEVQAASHHEFSGPVKRFKTLELRVSISLGLLLAFFPS